jgi:hypothetical protein
LSAEIAVFTASRVAGRTLLSPLMTRDTVIGDTPARRATSLIVGALPARRDGLLMTGAGRSMAVD